MPPSFCICKYVSSFKFYIYVWNRNFCVVYMRLNVHVDAGCFTFFGGFYCGVHWYWSSQLYRNSKQRTEHAICSSNNSIGVLNRNDRLQIEHWTFATLYLSGVFVTRFDLRRAPSGVPWDSKSWWRRHDA